jgi:hypothetical protein
MKYLGIIWPLALWMAVVWVTSCASVDQTLELGLQYRRDIGLTINGKSYDGVAVLPKASKYEITIAPPKAEISIVIFKTCHRDKPFEPGTTGVLFWKSGKDKYTYIYEPVPGLEDNRVCPLLIDVYDSKSGKHAWAHIDFEHEAYRVRATLTCDGEQRPINGVGLCQAKKETIQRIQFDEPVRFAPQEPGNCYPPKRSNGAYEIKATGKEKCLYHFDTQDGKLGRLTIVGYEGVLVRETQ